MKVIVTGSLGNISKPLAIELVQKGHTVTIISSKPEKQIDIEDLAPLPPLAHWKTLISWCLSLPVLMPCML